MGHNLLTKGTLGFFHVLTVALGGPLLASHFRCMNHEIHEILYWVQIFFVFTPTWGDDPIWLLFFKWVETTNQTIVDDGISNSVEFVPMVFSVPLFLNYPKPIRMKVVTRIFTAVTGCWGGFSHLGSLHHQISTPLKINMEPKWRFGKWFSYVKGLFFGFHVNFRGSN